jgi:hypothetical protein
MKVRMIVRARKFYVGRHCAHMKIPRESFNLKYRGYSQENSQRIFTGDIHRGYSQRIFTGDIHRGYSQGIFTHQ